MTTPGDGLETPVLFLVFRRPDTTRRVFERIRSVRPRRLYIAADGPREDRPGEADLCREVRDIVTQIDWECDLKTLFRESNEGCKTAISGAISWFFEDVDRGIILEDDVLPHPDFFRFCHELLERYRDDTRIMQINGGNFLEGWCRDPSYSYYFSQVANIWGWATWRRAWRLFDINMTTYGEIRAKGYMKDACASKEELVLKLSDFDSVYTGRVTSAWGHLWKFSILVNHGLSITPNANLINNIGFGAGATHTHGNYSSLPYERLEFPLRHPPFMIRDTVSDKRRVLRHLILTHRWPPKGWWAKVKWHGRRGCIALGIRRKPAWWKGLEALPQRWRYGRQKEASSHG